MHKMILDVDTGIDDALALIYACSNPDIDLLAVTTTYGNVTLDVATKNTLDVLHLVGCDHIPVYPGCSHSLHEDIFETREVSFRVHGRNGVGNVVLEPATRAAETTRASKFMVEAARKYGKELNLVCVGPMNNLAEAIALDYKAISNVGSITLMAGALTVRGNASMYAEANIIADAEAARQVFDSKINLRVIPLDVTWQTLIREKDITLWNNCNSSKMNSINAMAAYYYSNEFKETNGGGAMHDPLAVEASVNPDIISNWFRCNLTVETNETSYGRLIGNKQILNDDNKTVTIALDVFKQQFIDKFVNTIYQFTK